MSDREPIFNIPMPVAMIAAAMVAVHLFRLTLSPQQDIEFLLSYAFIPARLDATNLLGYAFPGGLWGEYRMFITHAFIHADWGHLLMNGGWLIVFGSAVAWRFGALRFFLFYAMLCAAGAATHWLFHQGEVSPLIGASGAISGLTGAAFRFVFASGRFPGFGQGHEGFQQPAIPLLAALRDRRVLMLAGVYIGLNLLTGALALPMFGAEGGSIAFEVHIGGFLAGLLFFSAFDPIKA